MGRPGAVMPSQSGPIEVELPGGGTRVLTVEDVRGPAGGAGPAGPAGAAGGTGSTGATGATGPKGVAKAASAPGDTGLLWADTSTPGAALLLVTLTQAAYDALTPDPSTVYVIVG